MSKEKISDEEAIKHFKKRLIDKISLKKRKDLKVVAVKPSAKEFMVEELSIEEIYQHMLKKDEIGRRHIEIEKHWMREAKRMGME